MESSFKRLTPLVEAGPVLSSLFLYRQVRRASPAVSKARKSRLMLGFTHGMASAGKFECRKGIYPLFAQGREVSSNTTKDLSTKQATETARDLLLHLDHANIALGLRVLEGHVIANAESG